MSSASEASSESTPATRAAEARGRVLGCSSAALGTLAREKEIAGYPFGSVVPYALTARCEPILLMSSIAQHSKNLTADPRASLLVQAPDPQGDPQATWRVTLVGDMARLVAAPTELAGPEVVIGEEKLAEIHARYLERVPEAGQYFEMHDFSYWRLAVRRVRSIGGFARIHWVEAADFLTLPGAEELAAAAPGIIDHLNRDHRAALLDCLKGLRDLEATEARIEALDSLGFQVRTTSPDRLVHFSFPQELVAGEARAVFVELVRRARAPAPEAKR